MNRLGTSNSVTEAATDGDINMLKKYILEKGISVNSTDDDERTPLHWAAAYGETETVQFLLSLPDVDIDHQDDSGWTALMSAVSAGHVPVVEVLLQSGADPNKSNENGQVALHYHKGRQEMVELLLDYTSDLNKQDSTGMTALMRAAGGKPSPAIVDLLLGHGASVNSKDINGDTALHHAVTDKQEAIATRLVQHGADIHCRNREKQTPLDLAASSIRAALLEATRETAQHITP